MAEHNELGKRGEKLTELHLEEKGYQLLHRNWRFKHEEIDLIFETADEIVFVEVKTRSTSEFGDPLEAITASKIKHLIEAADQFIVQNEIDKEGRFDVVTVLINSGKEPVLEHIPDAFGPEF